MFLNFLMYISTQILTKILILRRRKINFFSPIESLQPTCFFFSLCFLLFLLFILVLLFSYWYWCCIYRALVTIVWWCDLHAFILWRCSILLISELCCFVYVIHLNSIFTLLFLPLLMLK